MKLKRMAKEKMGEIQSVNDSQFTNALEKLKPPVEKLEPI